MSGAYCISIAVARAVEDDPHGQPMHFPTPDEQQHAIDVITRMALGDGAMTTLVIDQLASLQPVPGLRVANIMLMLAGCAVEDPAAWAGILVEHLAGARKAMRERAVQAAASKPMLGERH